MDDPLDRLAESLADGDSINWDELNALPPEDPRRRLLDHFRVVAEIAEHHRSAVEDDVAEVSTAREFRTLPHRTRAPGHATVAEAGAAVGQWGHLLLLRKIGEGAFGEVFHAHDMWLDHPVALKLLKAEIAKGDTSSRILHEARRLARVRHPNVVAVHGADLHDGRLGFWMDLVDGETLSALVAVGRLSPGEAVHIGREVCLALAAVHQSGLVHRDVKAQNVMRGFDGGRIILMDFGAGQLRGRADAAPQGTPLYMAPELLQGAPADASTDIYALGVLMFHLVTGSYPVKASSIPTLIEAHARGDRRRLRDERADLPPWFVATVERAIDPDPVRRFDSAGDLYDALVGPGAPALVAAERGLSPLRWVTRAAGIAVAAAVFVEALGLLGSRVFEGVLRVDSGFAAGLSGHMTVGTNAVVPLVIVWTLLALVFAALVGLRDLVWPYTGALGRGWSRFTASLDPVGVATALVGAGVIALVLLNWSFYDVYYALTALALDPRPDTLDLTVLGPAGRPLHRVHSSATVVLGFALALAAARWFPRLEQRAANPGRIRAFRAAAVVVGVLAIAEEAATRPLLWDDREVVLYQNRRAVVIGKGGGELLVYFPVKGERSYLRVRVDSPELRRNVASRSLFEEDGTSNGR